jgi:hypothetical protein
MHMVPYGKLNIALTDNGHFGIKKRDGRRAIGIGIS